MSAEANKIRRECVRGECVCVCVCGSSERGDIDADRNGPFTKRTTGNNSAILFQASKYTRINTLSLLVNIKKIIIFNYNLINY